ncbi:hypothetical protein ADL04_27630 [Streptomyces sp. NRRL B-3648]|nr:hypothetical protein ADL04_27630 [Streptomyces sp. NRRL B-3648]
MADRASSATVSAACPRRPHGVTIRPPGLVCSTQARQDALLPRLLQRVADRRGVAEGVVRRQRLADHRGRVHRLLRQLRTAGRDDGALSAHMRPLGFDQRFPPGQDPAQVEPAARRLATLRLRTSTATARSLSSCVQSVPGTTPATDEGDGRSPCPSRPRAPGPWLRLAPVRFSLDAGEERGKSSGGFELAGGGPGRERQLVGAGAGDQAGESG